MLERSVEATAIILDFSPQNRPVYLKIRAVRAGVSGPPSDDYSAALLDFQDAVEALIFHTGALFGGDRGNVSNGQIMAGWEPGATVRVIVFASVSEGLKSDLRSALSQWPELTLGAIRTTYEENPSPFPVPQFPGPGGGAVVPTERNQLWVYSPSETDVMRICGAIDCTSVIPNPNTGVIDRAAVLLRDPPAIYGSLMLTAHELGHDLGLSHINPVSGFGRAREGDLGAISPSVMAGLFGLDQAYTSLDRAVLQAVYGAGLHAGSSRAQFRAAGLIH